MVMCARLLRECSKKALSNTGGAISQPCRADAIILNGKRPFVARRCKVNFHRTVPAVGEGIFGTVRKCLVGEQADGNSHFARHGGVVAAHVDFDFYIVEKCAPRHPVHQIHEVVLHGYHRSFPLSQGQVGIGRGK